MSVLQQVKTISLLVVTCVILAVTSVYTFLNYMPMSYWIEYYDVKPANPVVKVGEYPQFFSTVDVKRLSRLSFEDILHCKINGSFIYYAESRSGNDGSDPTDGVIELLWRFGKPVQDPGICYLESHITLHLPWGIRKTQTIDGGKNGNTFEVVE